MKRKRAPRRLTLSRDGLTPKEERFVHEYLRDFNATRAYLRAGYDAGVKTAGVEGCRFLAKPKIRAVVEREKAAALDRLKMDREELLVRAAALVRSNPQAVGSWKAGRLTLRDSDELTELEAYAIESVKETPGRTVYGRDGAVVAETPGAIEYRMRSPVPGFELLARHLGLAQPPGAAFVRTRGPAGVLLDGEGGVVIYVPDNGRGGQGTLPAPPVSGENGKEPGGG